MADNHLRLVSNDKSSNLMINLIFNFKISEIVTINPELMCRLIQSYCYTDLELPKLQFIQDLYLITIFSNIIKLIIRMDFWP